MSKKLSSVELMVEVRRILETPFWILDLSSNEAYSRLQDDIDGKFEEKIVVQIDSVVGDVDVSIEGKHWQSLRFRQVNGGGRSPKTRNALMILAYAMMLDNEEKPDPD